jgi:D-glycero-D-manno-heptose 1,7-bisphosphate phosphatase
MGVNPISKVRRAVFLDRDGVLNRAVIRDGKPFPPDSLEELEILPGVPAALAGLRAAGFLLIVVTNQPDVAKGLQHRSVVESMHQRLRTELPLDEILVCYHQDSDECDCRKPAPGLLRDAAIHFELDLPSSYMVGDRWRDVDAGRRAGCRTVLLDYGYRERLPENQPDVRVSSLTDGADWILGLDSRGVK